MTTSIRLPDDVLAAMHQLADEHDRTLNSEIIQACKAWIQAERKDQDMAKNVKIWNVSISSRNAGKQSKGHYAAATKQEAIEAMKQAWWPQGAPEPFPYQVVASVIEK